MNTDVILDFIVEYYLWFIIGGGILLLAIIGFIADKKKIFKKKNDKKIDNIQERNLQDITDDVNNVGDMNDNSSILENISNEVTPKGNIDNEANIANNLNNSISNDMDSQTSYFDEHVDNNEFVNFENTDNIIAENTYIEDSNDDAAISKDEQLINSTEDNGNKIDEKINEYVSKNNNDESINFEEPIVISNNDIRDELKYIDNLEINYQKEDGNHQAITENDNNIGDMPFKSDKSDDVEVINIKDGMNNKESNEPVTNEQLIDLNDKEDEPLNVSYSKLKEIVEEIISEQISEQKNEDKISNIQDISTSNNHVSNIEKDINQNIEPNLDQNAVEKIKQLDDDEDDVWKF